MKEGALLYMRMPYNNYHKILHENHKLVQRPLQRYTRSPDEDLCPVTVVQPWPDTTVNNITMDYCFKVSDVILNFVFKNISLP